MCLYPRIVKNPRYIMNKKNGGVIPAISDNRVLYVPIGCQECMECRKQKARGWQIRLLEDVRHNKNGKFVTLTFSNESINKLAEEIKGLEGYNLDNAIAKLAVRRFLERWRKKYKKSLRHWLVTELGHTGTEHLHLHGIVWTDESLNEVEKHWSYGWIWKGKGERRENYVTEKTMNYLTKYMFKVDAHHKNYKSIILTSAGIGAGYVKRTDAEKNKYKGDKTKETYTTRTGHEISMPIYWKNKIYTDEEREKLWIEKLNKEERWVNGERVDISKGDENYYKVLGYHREKNARLGYGTGEIDWDKKKYENERRQLKINERRYKK